MSERHPTAEQLLATLPYARGDDRTVLLIGLADQEHPAQEWWHELALGDANTADRTIAVSRVDGSHPGDDRVLMELLKDRARHIRLLAATKLSETGGPDIADAMFEWYERTLRPTKRIATADLHDVTGGVVYGLRTDTLERARTVLVKARARLAPDEMQAIQSWFPGGLESPWKVEDVVLTLTAVRDWRDQSSSRGDGFDMSTYILESYQRANKRRLRG